MGGARLQERQLQSATTAAPASAREFEFRRAIRCLEACRQELDREKLRAEVASQKPAKRGVPSAKQQRRNSERIQAAQRRNQELHEKNIRDVSARIQAKTDRVDELQAMRERLMKETKGGTAALQLIIDDFIQVGQRAAAENRADDLEAQISAVSKLAAEDASSWHDISLASSLSPARGAGSSRAPVPVGLSAPSLWKAQERPVSATVPKAPARRSGQKPSEERAVSATVSKAPARRSGQKPSEARVATPRSPRRPLSAGQRMGGTDSKARSATPQTPRTPRLAKPSSPHADAGAHAGKAQSTTPQTPRTRRPAKPSSPQGDAAREAKGRSTAPAVPGTPQSETGEGRGRRPSPERRGARSRENSQERGVSANAPRQPSLQQGGGQFRKKAQEVRQMVRGAAAISPKATSRTGRPPSPQREEFGDPGSAPRQPSPQRDGLFRRKAQEVQSLARGVTAIATKAPSSPSQRPPSPRREEREDPGSAPPQPSAQRDAGLFRRKAQEVQSLARGVAAIATKAPSSPRQRPPSPQREGGRASDGERPVSATVPKAPARRSGQKPSEVQPIAPPKSPSSPAKRQPSPQREGGREHDTVDENLNDPPCTADEHVISRQGGHCQWNVHRRTRRGLRHPTEAAMSCVRRTLYEAELKKKRHYLVLEGVLRQQDRNRTGELSYADFSKAIGGHIGLPDGQLDAIIETFDPEGRGVIDISEFVNDLEHQAVGIIRGTLSDRYEFVEHFFGV